MANIGSHFRTFLIKTEDIDPDFPEDQEDPGEEAPLTKRKRRPKLFLDDADEESLIEWVKDNPCLYVKGIKDYRDSNKRAKLWEDKAAELNFSVDDIQCWWKSIRTRFGKLSFTKSGDGARELTDRDNYIMTKLSFLERHIARMPSRQTNNVKHKNAVPFKVLQRSYTSELPNRVWRVGKLNHVAIAVPNLEKATSLYRDILGAKVSEAQPQPDHGVYTVFVELGDTKIELLYPYGEKSPVQNFLDKNKSGGMHHICLEVDNIGEAIKDLKAHSIRTLGEEPKIGAHGKPVIFLHPKDCNGTLVELEEA